MKRWIAAAALLLALPAVPAAFAQSPAPPKRYEIPLEGSPALGPAGAPVTLIAFIDFQ